MGGTPQERNARNLAPRRSLMTGKPGRRAMVEDREKISTGPNARPVNEPIAGTAPGIPDDANVPGKETPEPPTAEQERRIRERLEAEVDTLPLDGE